MEPYGFPLYKPSWEPIQYRLTEILPRESHNPKTLNRKPEILTPPLLPQNKHTQHSSLNFGRQGSAGRGEVSSGQRGAVQAATATRSRVSQLRALGGFSFGFFMTLQFGGLCGFQG